ncbi:hypothetical protein EJ03DRAFT_277582 [Teratosphaeria nubilosa]|uniref:C2H2-type domain-containing protein n=1 Tax=Teratosphaeria nubilosa TaxID=161662 RepID=A0A6G1L1C3_9PEZI|nr:hypothetical protein EJ03DRAFT_277582 [Teratosphaeria nubilosa]
MVSPFTTTGSQTPSIAREIITPSATAPHSRASSISGGVKLTPTSSYSLGEWDHINHNHARQQSAISVAGSSIDTITYANSDGSWPCAMCSRAFKKKKHLLDHLNSPVHALKMLHCPTTLVGLHASGKGEKKFKTLSGMAKRIEVGACSGGKGMLATIVAMFEQKIKEATGQSVKLLKGTKA